jgi:hypothetical protein
MPTTLKAGIETINPILMNKQMRGIIDKKK